MRTYNAVPTCVLTYNTLRMRSSASKKLVVVVLLLVLAGCAQAQDSPTGAGNASRQTSEGATTVLAEGNTLYECGARAACARTTPHQESTVYLNQILTGTITDRGEGLYLFRKKPGSWILVEENPDADCGGDKGSLKPGCEKMYFDITNSTRVLQEEGNDRVAANATDLKKRQRVSADYTGYDVAMSYPSQTDARAVVIMKTP